MPQRKHDNATPPSGPTELLKPSALRGWLERGLQEAERAQAHRHKRLKAAFPWFQPRPERTPNLPPEVERELQTKLPIDATEAQRERRLLLQQWARQTYEFQCRDRELEATERALEQRLEQQERERGRAREKRRIRKLEREMRERGRQMQELEQRLEAIRAPIEKAIAGIDVQANLAAARALIDRTSAAGKASAAVRGSKDWHVAARALFGDNPGLKHGQYVRKIETEVKPPVKQRAVEAFVTKLMLKPSQS